MDVLVAMARHGSKLLDLNVLEGQGSVTQSPIYIFQNFINVLHLSVWEKHFENGGTWINLAASCDNMLPFCCRLLKNTIQILPVKRIVSVIKNSMIYRKLMIFLGILVKEWASTRLIGDPMLLVLNKGTSTSLNATLYPRVIFSVKHSMDHSGNQMLSL